MGRKKEAVGIFGFEPDHAGVKRLMRSSFQEIVWIVDRRQPGQVSQNMANNPAKILVVHPRCKLGAIQPVLNAFMGRLTVVQKTNPFGKDRIIVPRKATA